MPDQTQQVFLPAVLADFYGVSQETARKEIIEGKLTIGEVPITLNGESRLWFDRELLEGKEVFVEGGFHSFKFTYQPAVDPGA